MLDVAQADKPLVWLHGEFKTPPFSAEARIEVGTLLRRLQCGERLGMPASRSMSIIRSSVAGAMSCESWMRTKRGESFTASTQMLW